MAGFPKSGVTWLQYIVQLIVHRSTSHHPETKPTGSAAQTECLPDSCMPPRVFIGDFAPWLERHPRAKSQAAELKCRLSQSKKKKKKCRSSSGSAAGDRLRHHGGGSVFKTHLTPDALFGGAGSCAPTVDAEHRPAVIVVVREGKDVCVSMWHHWRAHYASDINIDDFFDRFAAGAVDFGSFLE